MIVFERGAKPEQVQAVEDELRAQGVETRCVRAAGKPVLHVLGGRVAKPGKVLAHDAVEGIVATSGPRIRREGHRFYPYHALQWFAIWIVVVAVLVLFAGQLPPGIGVPIDLQTPPSQVVVPWYGRAATGFLALFPQSLSWLAWTVMVAVAALLVALPRLDRSAGRPRLVVGGAVLALVFAIGWLAIGDAA